jgi:hypothetical protein
MNNQPNRDSIFTWKRSYHAEYPDVSAEAIWQTWQDVNNWPLWHHNLESCTLEGPFQVGAQFIVQAKGAPRSKPTIIQIEKDHSFTDRIKFFGATMYNIHSTTPTKNGITITHTVLVQGVLSLIWINFVAKKIVGTAPLTTNTLVAYAQRTYQK